MVQDLPESSERAVGLDLNPEELRQLANEDDRDCGVRALGHARGGRSSGVARVDALALWTEAVAQRGSVRGV